MVQELRLPELGENIESAIVSAILVSPGEAIRKEQPVIEVETDKATAEVPCPFEGVVKEIHAANGKEIKVGELILTLEAREGAAAAGEPPESEPAGAKGREREEEAKEEGGGAEAEEEGEGGPEEERRERKESGRRPAASAAPPPDRDKDKEAAGKAAPTRDRQKVSPLAESVPAAPAVRRLARELGIDIAGVTGTGGRGRITAEDVTVYARGVISSREGPEASAQPASAGRQAAFPSLPDFEQWGPTRREPLGGVRRKTAEQMSLAWSVVPHVTQCDQADITGLEEERRLWAGRTEAAGGKLTLTCVALKAAATALRLFPRFNASLDPERQEIIYKSYVHVGVAVDAGHGLLVPVVRDADRKTVLELAVELAALAQKARDKKLSLEEMRGGGFTISNLGALGTTYFSPIVNWPEVAILGIGRAARQPVERDGSFVPRLILPLSLSYDHRVIDGAQAARFLRWIAEALEHPFKLVLEG